jgi:hypothetical protein
MALLNLLGDRWVEPLKPGNMYSSLFQAPKQLEKR